MTTTSVLIGIGANRRHGRHGAPAATVAAALDALDGTVGKVTARSAIMHSRPIGPGDRLYANAAAMISTTLDPLALLAWLKAIERGFGRRAGRRWGSRVLDLDILASSGGGYRHRRLDIPHRALEGRIFALAPAAAIAPDWRLPRRQPTLRQLLHRLRRPHPVDRPRPRP